MAHRRPFLALASALVLIGCNTENIASPEPPPSSLSVLRRSASLVSSFDLPIQFPTGLALNGTTLYLSTGFGARDTYVIDRVLQSVVGTIPTGGEPRDVSFDGVNLLFSDLNNAVVERTVLGTFVNSFPIPFRGGGIATDGDTIWTGDIDVNQMVVTNQAGFQYATYPTGVRLEGAVLDPSSHTLWVVTPFNNKLYEMTTLGTVIRECDTPYDPGPFGLGGVALVVDTFYIAHPQGGDPFVGTTILIIDKASLVCTPSLVMVVGIQLAHSKINLKSHGVIKVAILSDGSFNAATVDVSSVRFGHSGTEAAATQSSLQDVDSDGDVDLAVWFKIQDTGILCGDATAHLTGKAGGGQPIKGSVAIQTKC